MESAREKSPGTNTDQHWRTSWRRDFPLGYRHVSVVFPNRKSNMRQTNMITCCSDQLADELVVYFFREQQQHPLFTSFSVCSCCYARVAKTTHSFISLAARVQNRYAWPIPEQNLPVQHLLFPAAPHFHSPNNIPPLPQTIIIARLLPALQIIYRFRPPLDGSTSLATVMDERNLEGRICPDNTMVSLLLNICGMEKILQEDFSSPHTLHCYSGCCGY